MSSASSTVMESAVLPFGSFDWFKRQLVPTRLREIRTAIMVAGAVLCVIISMALQLPELVELLFSPSALAPLFYFTNSLMVIRNCAFPGWQSRCFSECGCRAFL